MNIGVLTSGFFHLLLGVLLFLNIENLLLPEKNLIDSVKVSVISEKEYSKLISGEKIEKSEPLKIGKVNLLKPVTEKNEIKTDIKRKIRPVGNELTGLTEPDIKKVKKRKTPGEIITGTAQRGEDGNQHSKNLRMIAKDNTSANKPDFEKENKKNTPTTTIISSEGTSTAIVSGAIKIAKVPLIKPREFNKLESRGSTEWSDNASVYDQLVNEVANENLSQKNAENQNPMQKLAIARMLEKLKSNWNVVSINRLPNFEKYVIILEIPLNSRGNIIGSIKTVYPKSLKGNFLIAKRSATNAVLESTPFQVPKEMFPNGLILRVVFDPRTNIGAGNG